MKAVNLVPSEARRSSSALSGLNVGTTAVFAALGLGLALTVAYVILANGVTTRKDELAKVTAQSVAAQQQVAKLKPYADLEALRESLLERVRSLSGGRYDWPTALSRIARALPKDTTLTNFDGTPATTQASSAPAAAPAASGGSEGSAPAAAASAPAAAPANGPTVNLQGCTPSHVAVARVIDRLRAVEGVSSSGSTGETTCPGAETFKLTIQLSAPAAPAAPAAGATPSTTTSSPAPASPQASTGIASGGNS
jgi:hypothetical protein